MLLEQVKERFRTTMAGLFQNQSYPPGQLRDVWRVYFMAAVEELLAAGCTLRADTLMVEAQQANLGDPNWWPDTSFQWWT